MGGASTYTSYSQDTFGVCDCFGSTSVYNLGVLVQNMTQYHVYEVSSQSNGWSAWVNGVLQYQSTANTVSFSRGITLGSGNSGNGGGKYFAGDIAEVLVFNRALTADERVSTGDYLVSKYGLSQYATNTLPPTAPTNLIGIGITLNQINLQWNQIVTNGVGFIIERKMDGTNSYQEIGCVSSGLTNFLDTTVSWGNQYIYRIKSENYFAQSAYSPEASPPVVSLALLSTSAYIIVGT